MDILIVFKNILLLSVFLEITLTGPLCSECTSRFYKDGLQCAECKAQSKWILPIMVILIFLFIAVTYALGWNVGWGSITNSQRWFLCQFSGKLNCHKILYTNILMGIWKSVNLVEASNHPIYKAYD